MEKVNAPAIEFDLADIEDIESAEVQLKRNGQPLPIFVTLAGPEHAIRRNFALAKQRKMRKQLSRSGKVEFADPVEDEAEETDHLAACVLGWRGVAFGGEVLDCNKANITRLLTDPKRAWFRKSVKEAFDDGEVFIKTSAAA